MSDICKPRQAQQLAVNVIDNLINGISLRFFRIWDILLFPGGTKTPIGIYQDLLQQYLDHQLGIFIDLVDFSQYLTKGNVNIQAVSCAGHIHLLKHLFNMNQGILHMGVLVEVKAFKTLPKSLQESARIDGANEWTILFRIVVPLSKAVLAVMLLFYAVGHWNEWFNAMIYLRDRGKFPLQLILRELLVEESQTATVSQFSKVIKVGDLDMYKPLIRYTTIVIATVPVLCFYPFIQKYFVKGVMVGSIKG